MSATEFLTDEEANELVERLAEEARQMGLYAEDASLLSPDLANPDVPSDVPQVIAMALRIGDVAFSTRVQDPEQYDADRQFGEIKSADKRAEIERIRAELDEEWLDDDD